MNSLPMISHRMFAAAAGQPAARSPGRGPSGWSMHTVAPSKVISLEVVPAAKPAGPARRLKVWPGRSHL